jgi:hypothetical protein
MPLNIHFTSFATEHKVKLQSKIDTENPLIKIQCMFYE